MRKQLIQSNFLSTRIIVTLKLTNTYLVQVFFLQSQEYVYAFSGAEQPENIHV
jgi:hypothetical protein